ncbi:MAG: hypothetical protein DHS20C21_19620 [Gemmatimonadota bacterium]|nr:MAG: hypothetical protein DHS20C21_19620 [Gemmatimonadota bacterium]
MDVRAAFEALVVGGLFVSPASAGVGMWVSLEDGPGQQELAPWVGHRDVNVRVEWLGNSACQVEFAFVGDFTVVAFQPSAGIENLGSVTSPLLLPVDPSEDLQGVVGTATIDNPDGRTGALCFGPRQETARSCYTGCSSWDYWQNFDFRCIGVGQAPLSGTTNIGICGPVPVSPDTWGRLKSSYRSGS